MKRRFRDKADSCEWLPPRPGARVGQSVVRPSLAHGFVTTKLPLEIPSASVRETVEGRLPAAPPAAEQPAATEPAAAQPEQPQEEAAEPAPAEAGEKVTLTINSWRNDDLVIWEDTIIPAFNKHYPNIEVTFSPDAPPEYNAALNAKIMLKCSYAMSYEHFFVY